MSEKFRDSTCGRVHDWPSITARGGDWLKLSAKQREDVITLRDRMNSHLIVETEAFYAQHPELKLTWSIVCDALIRVDELGISEGFPSYHEKINDHSH